MFYLIQGICQNLKLSYVFLTLFIASEWCFLRVQPSSWPFLAHSRCSVNICALAEGEGIGSNRQNNCWKITQNKALFILN